MPDQKQDPPIDLGLYGQPSRAGFGVAEAAAVALGLLWLAAVGTYMALRPDGADTPGPLMIAAAVLVPTALLAMAVATLRTLRTLRAEAARLQAAVDAMRKAYVAQQQAAAAGAPRGLSAPAPRGEGMATHPAQPSGVRRPAPPERRPPAPPPVLEEQPGLALGPAAEDSAPPLSPADFITAVNFPESAEDHEGFRALKAALDHRGTARLVRSAQDVLTLLSQDGLYMDDLVPDRARPEIWRRFALGDRGRAVAALGGLRDKQSLSVVAARMREDPVFRDAAHHFLRQFDRSFQEFEQRASDADLAALAETRTARAFMLLGRVTGTFD